MHKQSACFISLVIQHQLWWLVQLLHVYHTWTLTNWQYKRWCSPRVVYVSREHIRYVRAGLYVNYRWRALCVSHINGFVLSSLQSCLTISLSLTFIYICSTTPPWGLRSRSSFRSSSARKLLKHRSNIISTLITINSISFSITDSQLCCSCWY